MFYFTHGLAIFSRKIKYEKIHFIVLMAVSLAKLHEYSNKEHLSIQFNFRDTSTILAFITILSISQLGL